MKGNLLAQSLLFIVAPFLSRIYSPDEFGIYTVYLSLISIFSTTMALSLERAIPLAKSKSLATLLVKTCLIIAFLLSSLIYMIYLMTGVSLFSILNTDVSSQFVLFLMLGIFFGSTVQTLTYWYMWKQQFSLISYSKMIQNVGTASLQLSTPILGLLGGDMIGRFTNVVFSGYNFLKNRSKVKWSRRKAAVLLKKYYHYPLFTSGSLFINVVTLQLPLFLITFYFGNEMAGYFGMGQRVIGVPIVLITGVLGQVFYSVAAKTIHTEPKQVFELYKKVVKKVFILGLPIYLLLAIFAPTIFALVFGAEWRVTGELVRVLTPVYYLQTVTVPVSQTLYLLGRQRTQLMLDTGRFLLIILCFGMASWCHFDMYTTLILYVLVASTAYLIILVVGFRSLQKSIFGNGAN